MASSTAVSKCQPPKARKRIVIGVPASASKQQVAIASTADSVIRCETDSVMSPDVRECGELGSSKASAAMLTNRPATGSKDAAKAKSNTSEADIKITRKRRADTGTVEVASKPAKAKKEKDPNEPKRPPTAFFLFMDEFRQTYKKANPTAKGGTVVSKAGSEKWKSMPDEAKEPFTKKCAEMKEEYQKAFKIYNSAGKDSIESTITDNAEGKCEGADESCEETAASAEYHANETEQ